MDVGASRKKEVRSGGTSRAYGARDAFFPGGKNPLQEIFPPGWDECPLITYAQVATSIPVPMAWLAPLPRVPIEFCRSCISVLKAVWASERLPDCRALLSAPKSVPGVAVVPVPMSCCSVAKAFWAAARLAVSDLRLS